MQLFVDDLLNLKLMHDGIFALSESPFDPNEVFDNVCEIFIPLLEAKKIKLTFCVDKSLGNSSRNNSLQSRNSDQSPTRSYSKLLIN